MKQLNVVIRKADNAPVLAADAVLAGEFKNNGRAHWQYGEGEIARPHDLWKRGVRANCHPIDLKATAHQPLTFSDRSIRSRRLRTISEFCEAPVRAASVSSQAFTSLGKRTTISARSTNLCIEDHLMLKST
jgi:hypothetical protein